MNRQVRWLETKRKVSRKDMKDRGMKGRKKGKGRKEEGEKEGIFLMSFFQPPSIV